MAVSIFRQKKKGGGGISYPSCSPPAYVIETWVVCLPFYTSLCSSLPSVFVLAENLFGLFQHVFSLSCWKPVSCQEDYVGKFVSLWYKAPQPLTSERGAMIIKLCQNTLPYFTTPSTLSNSISLVLFPPCPPRLHPVQLIFYFLFEIILTSIGASQPHCRL